MRSVGSVLLSLELFDSVDLNTPEGLDRSYRNLVNAGKSLVDITKEMVDSFKPLV